MRSPPRLSPPQLSPPRLSAPRPSAPRYSWLRQSARVAVWTLFGVVLWMRLAHPPEARSRGGGGRIQWDAGNRGGGEPGGGGWGRQRSARVNPPVSPVPADLWRLSIEIAPADVRKLQAYHWNGPWNGGRGAVERPEVRVTVREGGVVYTNVSLHPKGSAGSFREFNDKPALTLNFGKHAAGQRFHGFSKISLNNSVQDDAYLSEALSRELFVAAGVPAPQADHATVVLNGRDLGLYVLAEGWGKPFLRRHFKDVQGNLYDGGFVQDIDAALEVNSGEEPNDRRALDRLVEVSQEGGREGRWQRLGEVLDVDRFATFLALEVMLCHWDGYGMNRNNYRVFEDRSTGRLVFMPHGLDQLFGGGRRMPPQSSIEPSMQGMAARAFLGTTEGRNLFLARMTHLSSTLFQEEKLTNRVAELARRIRPTLLAWGPEVAARHDGEVADLCARIGERTRSIAEQLAAPRQPFAFGENGTLRVTGWRTRLDQDNPRSPVRFQRGEVDGRQILRIRLSSGPGRASWRARVRLGPGNYRFEGEASVDGLEAGGGVCLRISGEPREYVAGRAEEWFTLQHQFRVDEDLAEVELVCDFEAAAGMATFDEHSLRLVRE